MDLTKLTPMMRQYYGMKNDLQDTVLFFRMGDFYEIFGTDAELVAPILNIVLTSRERGDSQKIKFCGVPHHAAPGYWLKLLRAGMKIAVADQVENPAEAKGLVKRAVTKVMTPGCIDELEGLDQQTANYFMVIYQHPGESGWLLLVADVSTGELRMGDLKSLDEFLQYLHHYCPKELLIRRFQSEKFQELCKEYQAGQPLSFSFLPEHVFRDAELKKSLLADGCFDFSNLSSVGAPDLLAATLQHLHSMHLETKQFLTIKPLVESERVLLKAEVIQDLELLVNRDGQKKVGLFYHLNNCQTPMGARYLKSDLCQPYKCEQHISNRQELVSLFYGMPQTEIQSLGSLIEALPDLERLCIRIISGNIKPLEIEKVKQSLRQSKDLVEKLSSMVEMQNHPTIRQFLKEGKAHLQLFEDLEQAIVEQPKPLGSGLGIFQVGFDAELDECRRFAEGGQAEVEKYQLTLREQTSIPSLKVKHHKTFGVLLEVTKTHLSKVPDYFIRKQTMVNCERFVTEELLDLAEKMELAVQRAVEREVVLYQKLVQDLQSKVSQLKSLAYVLGQVDLGLGLGLSAKKLGLTRPKIQQDALNLQGAFHPVSAEIMGRHKFTPNDLSLEGERKLAIITGPNMGGKSTVMRQTAVCALLHQIGSYVPARSATMPIFDQIYTRVGSHDNLSKGQSTFMVEMTETAHILRNATSNSLILMDEVGRGTSTQDGLAIAHSVLEFLSSKVKGFVLFSTHYHELISFQKTHSNLMAFLQMEVVETAGNVEFSHQLIEGFCGNSFGLEVARLAGVPEEVLSQAKKRLLSEPAVESPSVKAVPAPVELTNEAVEGQQANEASMQGSRSFQLPAEIQELQSRLDRIKLNRITPLQALNILSELLDIQQGKAESPEPGLLF